jgi:hypothetical protein
MSCAINPVLMAHQWRNPFCAVIKFALVKTNGALVCAVWFFQWRANSANGAKRDKFFGGAAASAAVVANGRFSASLACDAACIFCLAQPVGKIHPKAQCNFEANSSISGVANLRSGPARRPRKEAKNGPFYGPIFARNERISHPLFANNY